MLATSAATSSSSSPCGASTVVRRKWADFLEGSDEDCSDMEQGFMARPAPVEDDSYREAPVPALQDANADLNLRVSRLASSPESTSSAPKDFSFLFERMSSHSTAAPDSSSEESRSQHDSSVLNAQALEFVPTLSHHCPLVGIYDGPSQAAPFSTLAESPRNAPAAEVFHCATPTKKTARGQENRLPGVPQSGKKTGAARKRKPVAAMDASVKRSRSPERCMTKPKMEIPDMSPEDWVARCVKRQRAIAIAMATPEYRRYAEAVAAGEPQADELTAPDPTDRSLSKRRWQYVWNKWRGELKRVHGLPTDSCDAGSTMSFDETLSTATGITDDVPAASNEDDGSSDKLDI